MTDQGDLIVSRDLHRLLLYFTISVLKNKPKDLKDFGIIYFKELVKQDKKAKVRCECGSPIFASDLEDCDSQIVHELISCDPQLLAFNEELRSLVRDFMTERPTNNYEFALNHFLNKNQGSSPSRPSSRSGSSSGINPKIQRVPVDKVSNHGKQQKQPSPINSREKRSSSQDLINPAEPFEESEACYNDENCLSYAKDAPSEQNDSDADDDFPNNSAEKHILLEIPDGYDPAKQGLDGTKSYSTTAIAESENISPMDLSSKNIGENGECFCCSCNASPPAPSQNRMTKQLDLDDEDTVSRVVPPPVSRRAGISSEKVEENLNETADIPFIPKSEKDSKKIAETISKLLLFQCLDREELQTVINTMTMIKVKKGDLIIKQGDDGDFFYVVDQGNFDVYVEGDGKSTVIVKSYNNQGCFGELALMYNMPRIASVSATSDGKLWALDRASFRKIVVLSAVKQRQIYEDLMEQVPFLKGYKKEDRKKLVDALEPMTFENGECIMREGDKANGMYFIVKGEVLFKQNTPKGEVILKNKSKLNYFGELGLIEDKPRSMSVYAKGFLKVGFLDHEAFERLMGPYILNMERIARNTYVETNED